jgi:type II secretory pathway component GspD/PulD (secretin)
MADAKKKNTQRTIEPISEAIDKKDASFKPKSFSPAINSSKVMFHFPVATEIEKVVEAISQISNMPYVINGNIQGKVRIFSPNPIEVDHALDLFEAALGVINLRAVVHSGVVKVVKNELYKIG